MPFRPVNGFKRIMTHQIDVSSLKYSVRHLPILHQFRNLETANVNQSYAGTYYTAVDILSCTWYDIYEELGQPPYPEEGNAVELARPTQLAKRKRS